MNEYINLTLENIEDEHISQNQLLQLQKELRSIETKKNVQKLISNV